MKTEKDNLTPATGGITQKANMQLMWVSIAFKSKLADAQFEIKKRTEKKVIKSYCSETAKAEAQENHQRYQRY